MGLVELLLPPACAGCGRYGAIFCSRCTGALRPASRDDERFLAADRGVVVGDALELGRAAFAYGGTLRRALASLKYGSAARVARPLAAQAAPGLMALMELVPVAALVPVPVHADRLRQRGYNQAALLAQELTRGQRLDIADVLERRRPTTQMHRLDRAARLRNLREAFGVRAGRSPPAVAILVDDILTTSATMEACAGALREAGTERVLGFAIAREL
ncbi:MAG TPA: ComF family protein [Candidatus Limnocylindria bacterium]|nr:ComF family protein [Candidatus Limnocylindria bacterium]